MVSTIESHPVIPASSCCPLGHESDDYRLATESGRGIEINEPGAYPTVCIEFALDGLAVTTVYKSHMINEYEGVGSTAASFDSAPQVSRDSLI